jgi:hypothetical protein
MPDPTYDGQFVLGTACHVVHTPHEAAVQRDSFFGISGVLNLWGGGRGRTFHVSGVLVGASESDVLAIQTALLSYDDGIARVFTDTYGVAWPNVLVRAGTYRPSPEGVKPCNLGAALHYSITLEGLS